jgi:hypothetical protein
MLSFLVLNEPSVLKAIALQGTSDGDCEWGTCMNEWTRLDMLAFWVSSCFPV